MNDDMITVTIPRPGSVGISAPKGRVSLFFDDTNILIDAFCALNSQCRANIIPPLYHWLGAEADAP